MIHVLASVKLKPGCLDDALACYAALVPQVEALEDGCIQYTPMIDCPAVVPHQERDEGDIVVVERWKSIEAFKQHIVMPHSAAFRARISPLLRERITVR